MSSLEMVAYINATREPGKAELRHDSFMAKVPTVLGQELAPKFIGTNQYTSGKGGTMTRAIYNFPKREACLMAMSYSYELQAKVFDAWVEAEEKLAKPVTVLPNFDDPIAAARAWIEAREAENTAKAQLAIATTAIVQAQPKVEFHDAVVAGDTVYSLNDAAKLLKTGRTKLFAYLRKHMYLQHNNVPYQRVIEAGWLESAFNSYKLPDGRVAPPTTYMTSKGLAYFQPKIALAKQEGSL
jgi:phage antirepressor YoqD-like protein